MSAARALVVGLLALVTVLAGCLGGPLSEEEAAERAELAVSSLAASMSRTEDGDIKRMAGTMTMTGDGADTAFDVGDVEMEVLWGQDGIVRVTVGVASGGFTMQFVAYCTETQTLFEWGNDVYASRTQPAGADSDALCHGMEEGDEFSNAGALLGSEEFAALDQQEITTHSDGSITAVYADPSDGSSYTFEIDRKGRIVRMVMSGPDAEGSFDVEYGSRQRIDVPTATDRIPANAYFTSTFESGTLSAHVHDSTERPPLAEIEVRVTQRDYESGNERTVLASFPAAASAGSSGAWTFTFQDVDADGRLSANDTFTVSNPSWASEWDYEIELYDTWADGYVNETPLPAPGFVVLLGALLVGLAFVATRRSRHA